MWSPSESGEASNLTDRHLEGFEGFYKDRFDFAPFARRFAATLSGYVPNGGIVMALNGVWGSGKTSVAQMVVTLFNYDEELRAAVKRGGADHERKALTSLRDGTTFENDETVSKDLEAIRGSRGTVEVGIFQPWLKGMGGNLRDGLYRELLERVSALAERRVEYAGYRDKLSDAVAFLRRHQGKGYELINMVGLILRGAEVIKDDEEKKAQRIGADVKSIFERLERDKCRIVLFVDDVDRMLPEQLYELMSAIRGFMDLPGLVIVLVYDEDRVNNAFASFFQNAREVNRNPHDWAAEFMHKIVQITFHLPAIDPGLLTALLTEKLRVWLDTRGDLPTGALRESGVADGANIDGTVRRRHWTNVREFVLAECLTTPRDVQRLFNSVTFNWGMLRRDLRLEDHIAIEALRLFKPEIFRDIEANLDKLLAADAPPNRAFDTPLYRTLFLNWSSYPEDVLAHERSFSHPDYACQYLDQRGSNSPWVRYGLDRFLSEDITANEIAERLTYLFELGRLPALRGDIGRRVGRRANGDGGEIVLASWRDGLAMMAKSRPGSAEEAMAQQLIRDLAGHGPASRLA